MLMESVEKHFRTGAAGAIRLEVAVDNFEAQEFYKHLGYETTGRIPRYYLGRLDAFTMEKQLQ
jgi:ribosomal protein S18 acetylase RimI-like enzyme